MNIQTKTQLNLFATTPKGLELLLVDELRALGASRAAEKLAGVEFTGDLELAYKACLWSRLANRILLPLAKVPAETPEALYAGVQTIAWDTHMDPEATLAVNFVSVQSAITHTLFGAQKVKDAIVDQLRDKYQCRPSVARERPDISVNVYLHRDMATISLDLSGDSLHRRNYRLGGGGIAPLKENLAAAILTRAGWPAIAKTGGMLVDPMCGSGTLLIEGALMAADIAPGLARDYFGFLNWRQHQPALWQGLVAEATERRTRGLQTLPPVVGYDRDAYAIKIAFENIERAGLLGKIHVEKRELATLALKEGTQPGLIVVNPPYGERIGEEAELQPLYALLGDKFKTVCNGWQGAVFTGNPDMAKNMGVRARKYYALFNGAIPCQLLLFDITAEKFLDRSPAAQNEKRIQAAKRALAEHDFSAVTMFMNRVRKNLKHLQRWAAREDIACYRVYDADLPEYAFSVDFYGEQVYVEEYPPPKHVDPERAAIRRQEVLSVLPELLEKPASQIFFQMKPRHHADFDDSLVLNPETFYQVHEGQATLAVNFSQPGVGTGLDLAQRKLRQRLQSLAAGAHFLNFNTLSGANTVAAAQGGALSTKTIVATPFQYQWVKHNLALNTLDDRQHQVVTGNPLAWLQRDRTRFHLIFADIPWVEDPEAVLCQLVKLLMPEGQLIFTAEDPRFKPAVDAFEGVTLRDIAVSLKQDDFSRAGALRCWQISG
jgi:23S rRNA (guanine2445-N2)-methyltransferase / 23S rRNA (guanine2069-N7)-methyltransferase